MWAIRNGRTGQFLESTSMELESIQHVARRHSEKVTYRVEVVELETMQVPYVYINGQEFIASGAVTGVSSVKISGEAAEELGKEIWEDLVARHLVLERLRNKLRLSAHEEKQFELTQDKVAEREWELSMKLTDAEYQCVYYTFVGALSNRQELTKPNYCERQIRRHIKKALIKTGQTAFDEEWKLIRLVVNKFEEPIADKQSGIHKANTN